MNLVIFGSTGRTGQYLVEQALEMGHTVTAFARTPSKLQMRHERLRIVQGDIHDSLAVDQAVAGQDAVLCALGRNRGEPPEMLAQGTHNILEAMKKHAVQRIICVSAAGFLGEHADFLIGKLLFWFFHRYLGRLFNSMQGQYRELENSGLEWTAIRPILLDKGRPLGKYRIVTEGIPHKGYRITTGDVAGFMLQQLESDEYIRKAPAIAY